MTKESLIASARGLKQPDHAHAEEYLRKRDRLAAEINRVMTERADVVKLVGEGNVSMMQDNHRNHARFMASMFHSYQPEVLVETVLWVFRAYLAHGFHLTYWPAQLDTWAEILERELSPETFQSIYPFYDWMIVNQAAFVALSGTRPTDSSSPS